MGVVSVSGILPGSFFPLFYSYPFKHFTPLSSLVLLSSHQILRIVLSVLSQRPSSPPEALWLASWLLRRLLPAQSNANITSSASSPTAASLPSPLPVGSAVDLLWDECRAAIWVSREEETIVWEAGVEAGGNGTEDIGISGLTLVPVALHSFTPGP